jgi:hypothetical protein
MTSDFCKNNFPRLDAGFRIGFLYTVVSQQPCDWQISIGSLYGNTRSKTHLTGEQSMSILDELQSAIVSYPDEKVAVAITDYQIIAGGSSNLNVSEIARFKVQVQNNGNLTMKNVKVQAFGSAYADISVNQQTWGSLATSEPFGVPPYTTQKSNYFYLLAKEVTQGVQQIAKARVAFWDAGFDFILENCSQAGFRNEGKLNKQVYPD